MSDVFRRIGMGIAIAGAVGLFAVSGSGATGSLIRPGQPSADYYQLHSAPEMTKSAPPAGLYQPNTDENYLAAVNTAKSRPLADARPWRNVGPFGGIESIPNIGDGAEARGPTGGIGTAIAVDPTDPNGNTAYLGGFGGLFKTTDGGQHVTNITDGKIPRAAIGAVAVDPKNPKTIYVGTGVSINTLSDDAVGTGVYVSHDGGNTFSRPSKNTHGYGINVITVNPDTGVVLAGGNYGLWRSTDHGASFSKVAVPTNANHTAPAAKPLGSTVSSIALHPGNPKEVTLAIGWARGTEALSDGTVIGTGNGLYRSTDDGKTFTFMDSSSQLTWAGATADPLGRISIAYATAAGASDQMWALVQDAGRNVGKEPHDLPRDPVVGLSVFGQTTLNGLYHSSDNGSTWTLEATPQTLIGAVGATTATTQYPLYGAGVQSTYNNWLVADPNNASRVFVGLEEVYEGDMLDSTGTAPLAMRWQAIAKYADACGFLTYLSLPNGMNGLSCPSVPFYGGTTSHPDQHAAAVAKTPNGLRLYEGNDGGFWMQDEHPLAAGLFGFDSNSWHSLNSNATVLPWDVNFLKDGSVVMALQDNGTIRLRKDGTAYNVCGGDGVFVMPGANDSTYYCGIPGLVILGTTDDFAHTSLVSPPSMGGSFLSPFTVDPKNPDHLLAAAASVAETTAGVNSNSYDPTNTVRLSTRWTTTFTPPERSDGLAWDASAAYTNGGVSYVGFCAVCRQSFSLHTVDAPSKVNPQVATNVGGNWHMAASKGLPHMQISSIAVDPKDPKTLYVTLRQYLIMTADQKLTGSQFVMVSHNAGESFTNLTGDLPKVDTHTVILRNGSLVVSDDVGVFTTKVGSTSWSRLGTGLPEVSMRSMKLDPTGRYLLVGAYGRGAWTFDFGAKASNTSSHGDNTQVKGRRITLPSTGGEENIVLGLYCLVLAAIISARIRRTAR